MKGVGFNAYGTKIPAKTNSNPYGTKISTNPYGKEIPLKSTEVNPYGKEIPVQSKEEKKPQQTQQQQLSEKAKSQKKTENGWGATARQSELNRKKMIGIHKDAEGTYQKNSDGKWEKTGLKKETNAPYTTKDMNPLHVGENKVATHRGPSKTELGGVKKTAYLNDNQLKQHELNVKNGKIVDAQGKNLDTTGANCAFKGAEKDQMVFTMNKDGKMHAADAGKEEQKFENAYNKGLTKDRYLFHHSSLTRGKETAASGGIEVKNGELKSISNKSGHYLPSAKENLQAINELEKKGVNTDNTKMQMWDKHGTRTRYVSEVKQAQGDIQAIDKKISLMDEIKNTKQGMSGKGLQGSKVETNMKPSDVLAKNEHVKNSWKNLSDKAKPQQQQAPAVHNENYNIRVDASAVEENYN
jgi:hypothetical protein